LLVHRDKRKGLDVHEPRKTEGLQSIGLQSLRQKTAVHDEPIHMAAQSIPLDGFSEQGMLEVHTMGITPSSQAIRSEVRKTEISLGIEAASASRTENSQIVNRLHRGDAGAGHEDRISAREVVVNVNHIRIESFEGVAELFVEIEIPIEFGNDFLSHERSLLPLDANDLPIRGCVVFRKTQHLARMASAFKILTQSVHVEKGTPQDVRPVLHAKNLQKTHVYERAPRKIERGRQAETMRTYSERPIRRKASAWPAPFRLVTER
jgi:hypothetical protein